MFGQVVQIQEKVSECPLCMKTILEIYFWSMHADEVIHFFRYCKDITAFECDPDDVLKEVMKKFEFCRGSPKDTPIPRVGAMKPGK